MKATFKIQEPEAVEVSMTITMTLRRWQILRRQLTDIKLYSPGDELQKVIRDLVGKAEAEFQSEERFGV